MKVIGDYEGATKYFDGLTREHTPFDIIAYSAYPFWSRKTVPEYIQFTNYLQARYGKPTILAETGFPWTREDGDDFGNNMNDAGPEPYPLTPQGQRDFLYELINAINTADDGMALGFEYWDPIWIPAKSIKDNVDNYTLFDFHGLPLPALTQAINN